VIGLNFNRVFPKLQMEHLTGFCTEPFNCLTHQNSMLIQGGPKVVHFSSHHIFGTVQDKIKRISPKCSDSFWEYRLGCISYAAGKYSLQISSVLVYRKMATFDGINWSYFFAITVRNVRRVSSFFFLLLLEMIWSLNLLKRFSPHFNCFVTLPC